MKTFKELSAYQPVMNSDTIEIAGRFIDFEMGSINIVAAPDVCAKTAFMHYLIDLFISAIYPGQLFVSNIEDEAKTYQKISRTIAFLHDGNIDDAQEITERNFPVLQDERFCIDYHTECWEQLKEKLEKHLSECHTEIVYIDHLQGLFSNKRYSNRKEELHKIMHELKELAVAKQVCIIVSCPVKRIKLNNDSSAYWLSRLKDEGLSVDFAQNIIMLYRYDYYGQTSDEQGNDTRGLTRVRHFDLRRGSDSGLELFYNQQVPTYHLWEIPEHLKAVNSLNKLIDTFNLQSHPPFQK